MTGNQKVQMKYLITVLLILLAPSIASSSDKYPNNQISTVPNSVRFEIVQSLLAVKGTFKIDKFTGNVFQLQVDSDGQKFWKKINKEFIKGEVIKKNNVNYQIFSSGIAMKFTYLINVNSGQTWQLIKDKDDILLFKTF